MKYSVKEMRDLKKDGFTNAEIAEQLGCPEELVEKKLARKKLSVKKVKKDSDSGEPSDVLSKDVPSKDEPAKDEPEVDPNAPPPDDVKRNWMGFKKKDQS